MKLTIFNCSPKHGINNTDVLLKKFAEGFKIQSDNEVYIYKLNKLDSMEEAVQIFKEAEMVMIAFPLYCYSMPGGVKHFIEALEPLCGKCKRKKLAFLVQYGFLEAVHARPLERYLIKLSKMLDCDYMSTIIKGACDGLSTGKGANNENILAGIFNIGETLGRTGSLNQSQINEYSMPEVEEKQSIPILEKIIAQVNEHYWGAMLRKNGVSIEESYAKPYDVLD